MKKVIKFERRGYTYEVAHDLPDGTCILRRDDGTHISETWQNIYEKYRRLTNVEFDDENDEIVNDEGWKYIGEPPLNRRRMVTPRMDGNAYWQDLRTPDPYADITDALAEVETAEPVQHIRHDDYLEGTYADDDPEPFD